MKQQEQQKHVKGIKVRKREKGTVRGTSKKEKGKKLVPTISELRAAKNKTRKQLGQEWGRRERKGKGHLASFPLLYTSELLMFPIQPSKFNKVWRMLSDPKLEYRKKLTVYPRSSHTKGIHTDKNLSKSLLNVVF